MKSMKLREQAGAGQGLPKREFAHASRVASGQLGGSLPATDARGRRDARAIWALCASTRSTPAASTSCLANPLLRARALRCVTALPCWPPWLQTQLQRASRRASDGVPTGPP